MSNLRLINETSALGGTNSVDVNNVFSADYDIYKITITNASSATQQDNNTMSLRLINSSGSTISSSNYDKAIQYMRGFSATYLELKNTNADNMQAIYYDIASSNGNANATIYLFNPFLSSSYTFGIFQIAGHASIAGQVPTSQKGIGVLKQTASMTGYSFFNRDSLNIASGTFRTYGLRVDS